MKAIRKDINLEIEVRKMIDDEIDNTPEQCYCDDETGTIYEEHELEFKDIQTSISMSKRDKIIRQETLLDLLAIFDDYNHPIQMTAKYVREEIIKFMEEK